MNTSVSLSDRIERPARFSLRLFGGFELGVLPGGERVPLLGRRERILLAYLALSPNCCQPRQKLAALLWGDSPDETALHNLRTCVWNLRQALGDRKRQYRKRQYIASEGDVIVLQASAFEVDALAFRRLATQSTPNELEAAANLYSGEFLEGLDVEGEELESWRREEAMRCRNQAIDVLARLMAQLAELGDSARAIEAGTRLLRLEPLHEAAVRKLMRLYSESGRRGAAVQLYRTLADTLRIELNTEPEAETGLVFAKVMRGGEDNARTVPPPRPVDETVSSNPTVAPVPPARRSIMSRVRPAILALPLIVLIALLFYTQFVARHPSDIADSQQPRVGTAPAASITQAAAISIAVLPFTTVSGDATQEFLSDGITDEIIAALARVPRLQVVARASAYEFKDKKGDMRQVARALGARYLVDGSVRQVGTHVRITAQLVLADTGGNVWSDSYDRELTDVLATREDIARAITESLRMPFGLRANENLANNRGIDEESYLQFLQAKALAVGRMGDRTTREETSALSDVITSQAQAVALLETIVARHPNFAPAWGKLALVYPLMPLPALNATVEERRRAAEHWLPKSQEAAEQAIRLDPASVDGYSALGLTMGFRGRLLEAEEFLTKALALDPNYPEALHIYANVLAAAGRYKESLAMRERLLSIEPFVPVYSAGILGLLWTNGETEALAARLKTFPEAKQLSFLAKTYVIAGDYNKAADTLLRIREGYPDEMAANAARLIRTPAVTPASPLPNLIGDLRVAYVRVGAWERIFEPLEYGVAAGYLLPVVASEVWHPGYEQLRRTERFKAFARNYGLVEYWRAKGWPPQCHPVGADDFECS